MTKINKIPKFNTIKEEADFWDKHSITDYLPELEPSKLSYKTKGERKEVVTIRFSPALKKELSKVADEYDISPSSLVRMWVVGKLHDVSKSD
ncbi:MAG: CopG family antitoxin [Patescibacteria group bacterium]|nr:BrnA antitoxin family protein [Patescibacteria group bacterium]MBU1952621.1 BrnA antitoxin family protein [Patescibacteria group bacterium]